MWETPDEDPLPPMEPGETRSDWVARIARDWYGMREESAAKRARDHSSFEERLDAIWSATEEEVKSWKR